MMSVSRDAAGPCLAPGGSVLAVGAFDGLHRGHAALLARVRERAAARAMLPLVISFEPLPRAFFARAPLPRLGSVRDKLEGLCAAGMTRALLLRFNAELAAMSAEDFVRDVLVRRAGAREIWVGADFRFGHARHGDVALLERLGDEAGFVTRVFDTQHDAGERVSSSAIRAALANGAFADAARLLGRPFAIGGRVVRGQQLGRTLGYPTANIRLGRRVSPVQGIFAVRVDGATAGSLPGGRSGASCARDTGASLPGVASLGLRPTVGGREPLLEVHLFDFDGDLYGRRLAVEFVAKLRDEEKFASLDALTAQMHRDAAAARAILGMPLSVSA
ncbi:MAG: bifunctional riboflavin kinase/FAD synthetase [Xanthomonadaceae bacterium]|nr:bifunctional riboflavin kinase/FAD synthetase [Xanthomonadaceae bacterium]MDE2244646.1 bifunctional riboflavin kinase/FAD synthetase [Xanthomonadaceae bacterium]